MAMMAKSGFSAWNTGFYNLTGTCSPCQASCRTWVNATAWTTWEISNLLNYNFTIYSIINPKRLNKINN